MKIRAPCPGAEDEGADEGAGGAEEVDDAAAGEVLVPEADQPAGPVPRPVRHHRIGEAFGGRRKAGFISSQSKVGSS